MTGLITRYRMHHILSKIRKLVYRTQNEVIAGDDLTALCHSPNTLEALKALEASGCVKCFYADSSMFPFAAAYLHKAPLYLCERSELWVNRIASYILGIISAFAGSAILEVIVKSL